MEHSQRPDPLEDLIQRLQDCSSRLNEQRGIQEPVPVSTVPILGPILILLRRLANRLATRWYVVPQMEQQARFAQEVTAAFDELAALLVLYEQRLNQQERRFVGHEGTMDQHDRAFAEHERILGEHERILGEHEQRSIQHEQTLHQLEEAMRLLSSTSGSTHLAFALLASLPSEALYAWEQSDLPPEQQLDDQNHTCALAFSQEGVLHFPWSCHTQGIGWHYLFNLSVLGMALNCRPGDLVLDFAGGSGWVSELLNRFGMHPVLLDYSELQLSYARARFAADTRVGAYTRLDLVAGDGMKLPFADGSFDGIVCMNALHHMPSYETVLREMARILKPGGRAVFGEPGEWHARAPLSQVGMRDYGDLEKNIYLPLIYTYAMRVGFERMWRYPYAHPEAMEFPYPGGGEDPAAILERMALILPDWLRSMSIFALEKEGERIPDSDLAPLAAQRCHLRAEITCQDHRGQVRAGEQWTERIRVKNTGDVLWLADYRPLGGHVRLGVSLCGENRYLIHKDMQQVFLPSDVPPGEEIELEVPLPAPAEPGQYLLRYDMVSEFRTSFEAAGSCVLEQGLLVTPMEEDVGK